MKYKVHTLTVINTKTGKKKADCELIDEQGNMVQGKVSIWGDYPNFETITFGAVVEGDLVPAKDPKYGPTLYPLKPTLQQGAARAGGFNPAKAIAQKNEMIEKAMDRKEDSFKVSGTARDATLLAIAEFNSFDHLEPNIVPTLEFLVEKWRKWLWLNYDKEDKDFPPFQ